MLVLELIRKRWLIILGETLVVVSVAVWLSLSQHAEFKAEAQVLAQRQDIAAAVTGATLNASTEDPSRSQTTQEQLAGLPVIAQRVAASEGGSDWKDLLKHLEVSSGRNSDIISMAVTDRARDRAERLASRFATEFVAWRRDVDQAAVATAEKRLISTVADLERTGRDPALASTLRGRLETLRIVKALQTGGVSVVQEAASSQQVAPRGVEQDLRARDVRHHERESAEDRAIDVALRREVDDHERLRARGRGERTLDVVGLRDVAVHEDVVRETLERREVLEVAGVRERVEVHDAPARPLLREHVDEVRADEAGAAGDEDHESGPRGWQRTDDSRRRFGCSRGLSGPGAIICQ